MKYTTEQAQENPRAHLFIITGDTFESKRHADMLTETDLVPVTPCRRYGRGRGHDDGKPGRQFRLYDDDGNLYFEGVVWDDGYEETVFAPLYWGANDSGCTEMRTKDAKGAWVTL